MAFFGRKKTTVGLDIGSGLVKVAVVDHSKSTPELVKVAITPLPDDAIVDGEVMDPHLVSDVIRTTIESVGANTKGVVAAVGVHRKRGRCAAVGGRSVGRRRHL